MALIRHKRNTHLGNRWAAVISLFVLTGAPVGAAEFITLGRDYDRALAVSDDGQVVAGGFGVAFRWTRTEGPMPLGNIRSTPGIVVVRGISEDGSVIVGLGNSDTIGNEAFRWTANMGMLGLGDLPGGAETSRARAVSANGAVVAGNSRSIRGDEGFRWTEADGMVPLGDLAGGDFKSAVYGISGDGTTIVGESIGECCGLASVAIRWTVESGMQPLGDFAGGTIDSRAYGASYDGSMIVGAGGSTNGYEAFRWTLHGGYLGLGDLPGGSFFSEARAVSNDGQVIVGRSSGPNGFEAFRWTPTDGMRSVKQWLADAGVDIGNWHLELAYDVNAAGNVVVGYATDPNGFETAFIASVGFVSRETRSAINAMESLLLRDD